MRSPDRVSPVEVQGRISMYTSMMEVLLHVGRQRGLGPHGSVTVFSNFNVCDTPEESEWPQW
eukprot:12922731-Prorocentrum_lima.AAC.1